MKGETTTSSMLISNTTVRGILLGFFLLLPMTTVSATDVCPKYTEEQVSLLTKAYDHGVLHDLGWTVSAIVVQEAFIGDFIVSINPKDGLAGSYGVMMTGLEWIMEYEGVYSFWEAKSIYPLKLMSDHDYAITMGINHLLKDKHRGWREMVKRYNGHQRYVVKIARHIGVLKKCYKQQLTVKRGE